MSTGPAPMEVTIQQALGRAAPASYLLRSTTVLDLLVEAVELAKILATEERDLAAIRAEYEIRSARLANNHTENVMLINREYDERQIQINMLNDTVHKLITANQFIIAQQLMNRLADILAASPLDKVLKHRN